MADEKQKKQTGQDYDPEPVYIDDEADDDRHREDSCARPARR